MDLTHKQTIAQQAVKSISRHFDAPVDSVHFELDKLTAFIAQEKADFATNKPQPAAADPKE